MSKEESQHHAAEALKHDGIDADRALAYVYNDEKDPNAYYEVECGAVSDVLAAEVERLRADIEERTKAHSECVRERNKLKADVEAWTLEAVTRGNEVERLRADLQDKQAFIERLIGQVSDPKRQQAVDKLRAEIEALRAERIELTRNKANLEAANAELRSEMAGMRLELDAVAKLNAVGAAKVEEYVIQLVKERGRIREENAYLDRIIEQGLKNKPEEGT